MDRTLSQGTSGADVRTAQAYLNYHLATPGADSLVEDGIFGPATRAKTIEFQKRANLKQDGIIGPATRSALLAFQTVSTRGSVTPKVILPPVPNVQLDPSLRKPPDWRKSIPNAYQPPEWFFPVPRDTGWQIKKWEFQGSNEFDVPWSDTSPAQISVEATFLRRVDGKQQEFTIGNQESVTPRSEDGKWNAQFYIKRQWEDVIPQKGRISWLNPWIMGYLKGTQNGRWFAGAAAGNETTVDLFKNSEGKTVLSFVLGQGVQCDLVDLDGPKLIGKPNLIFNTGFKITIEPRSGWQGPPPGASAP
jgi:hypothetical protein